MKRTYPLVALLATAALWFLPGSAQAKPAWKDCSANGGNSLSGRYTIAELNHALRTMPSSVEEYSHCLGVIQAQLQAQLANARPQPKAYASADRNQGGGGSTPLIVAIVVVAVGGGGLAFWASRRRGGGTPPSAGPPA